LKNIFNDINYEITIEKEYGTDDFGHPIEYDKQIKNPKVIKTG